MHRAANIISWKPTTQPHHRPKTLRYRQPVVIDALEPRRLLSSYLVTTLADSGDGSLRAEVAAANADGGPDTITFQSGLHGIIELTTVGDYGFGPAALLVTGTMSIDGNNGGSGITIEPTGTEMRIFDVSSTGDLTLNALTLSGGNARGGNGGSAGGGGGGGGAGLGGAIFNAGTLTITSSTFTNNQANGGSGGTGTGGANGYVGAGGGGMGGDGGSSTVEQIGGDGGNPNFGAGQTVIHPVNAAQDGGFGGGGGGGCGGSNLPDVSGSCAGGNGGFGGGGGSVGDGGFGGSNGGFGGGGGFVPSGGGSGGFGGGNEGGAGGGGGGAGMGGAVFNYLGTITIEDSTFTGNTAAGGAGGAGAVSGDGLGGAIFNYSGTINGSSDTISLNVAPQGGRGVYNLADGTDARFDVNNTVIGQSDALVTDYVDQQINGGGASSGGLGNLIGEGISPVSPDLGPLASNGGPTQTMLPGANSPLINAGNVSVLDGLGIDQIGNPRTADGHVDIGAVELETYPDPFITSASAATFPAGLPATFTITTTGSPIAAITELGTLPAGVTLTDNHDGTATLAGIPRDGISGSFPLTISANNGFGITASQSFALTIVTPPPIVVSAGIGGQSLQVDNPDGIPRFTLTPFPDMNVGATVALADVNQDGTDDIIAAAGPGGRPLVEIFNGTNGDRIAKFLAFSPDYSGGLYVAAADVNHDGIPDIIVSKGTGVGRIKVFDGATDAVIDNFLPFTSPHGGTRVAAADIYGDGYGDIVAAQGAGIGASKVYIFGGQALSVGVLTPVGDFTPFPSWSGELNVGIGPIQSGQPDIIVAKGARGGPRVSLFYSDGALYESFQAFDPSFLGGVRVAGAETNGVGIGDVITATGSGIESLINLYGFSGPDGDLTLLESFTPYGASFTAGTFVAGSDTGT